jgi:5-(carboxyamino)imidazole ribonucleotide mutase
VATVAIDGAVNAGYLAAEIVATADADVRERLLADRRKGREDARQASAKISQQ